jgi:hypothetical protein
LTLFLILDSSAEPLTFLSFLSALAASSSAISAVKSFDRLSDYVERTLLSAVFEFVFDFEPAGAPSRIP